jgi:hypothetical protein
VVQAHQFRRDQEPDEFEKRNPVTGGWKHGSTWKVDKTDEVTEGRGSGYKEIEFVCANPEFPDATDHALQKQMYAGLQKIPGVIPLFQDQSDYSEGQYSLTAIYKDPPVRGQILKLAKQLGVSVDLERPVTDDYVDRAVRGEHEGQQDVTEDAIQEDAVMGKIEQSGKIVRILKKQHTVPFSDEKDWLLIDTDPARGNRGLGLKWIPASTRFEWVRPYRDTIDENFADGRGPGRPGDSQRHGIRKGATMAELEKASHAKGRKGQLARWQLNMRRGRKK